MVGTNFSEEGEADVRSVVSHGIRQVQEGGKGLLMFGPLTEYLDMYGIGDHRLFIIDLHTDSLVGPGPPREHHAASRQLNTRLPHVVKKKHREAGK